MSAPMVLALLDGRKTQTRRIVNDKRLTPKCTLIELLDFLGGGGKCEESGDDGLRVSCVRDYDRQDENGHRYKYTGLLVQSEAVPEDGAEEIPSPYGLVGDRLWVRETFRVCVAAIDDAIITFTDGTTRCLGACSGDVPDSSLSTYFRWVDRSSKRNGKSITIPAIHMPRWTSRVTLELTGVRVERLQEISEADAKAEGVSSDLWTNSEWKHPVYLDGLGKIAASNYASLWDSLHGKGAWDKNPWVWVLEFKKL